MFELKMLESDESEDTARAAHQRILKWCLRLGTYLLIWTALSTIGTRAAPAAKERLGAFGRAGYHVWCNTPTGTCGLHDAAHHPVAPVAHGRLPVAPTP